MVRAPEGDSLTSSKRLLVTGAAGYIANLILPGLSRRYNLRFTDLQETDVGIDPSEGWYAENLLDSNRDTYRHLFRGIDMVIHLAYVNPPEGPNAFAAEFSNIQMAYNVYQTACEEDVQRVIVASSNHAANFYEPLILDHRWDRVTPEMRALARDYYGWSKEASEHLGFVFAVGEENRKPLEVVQLRIGAPRDDDLVTVRRGDLRAVRRALAAYISADDLLQLFVRSIETKDIRDEWGVPFQVFYGTSNNACGYWSLVNARKVIGYEPQDIGEVRFAKLMVDHISAFINRETE
jgi:nucleoside-diphosphate-sugar epimerase